MKMDEILSNKMKSIDLMLEKNNYSSAVEELRKLSAEFPKEGVIPYYLGRFSLIGKDEELALKYFLTAIKMGYVNTDVYLSMALIQKNLSSENDTEKSFLKAVELAETKEHKWTSISCLTVFYLENEMYLKAKKMAKKLISEFPDNYQGYHFQVMIEALKDNFDEVNSYMEIIPEKFKNHPQYLIDMIEVYKKQGKTAELSKKLDEDSRFAEMIPQIVLREKIRELPNDELSDEKEKLIRQLANDYHDSDAIISVMVLEFSRRNFKKSSEIANIVLDNEKENGGIKYYLALYFQIFNLYFLAEKKPSDKLRKWIEKAGNWCISFVEELNISSVTDTVRTSIQELFEEINNTGANHQ